MYRSSGRRRRCFYGFFGGFRIRRAGGINSVYAAVALLYSEREFIGGRGITAEIDGSR